ncbi:MAG: beta-mannosidase [Clostridia bacterium]|nr:beta-mannosidase [Clostridia bacterium]
MKRSAALLLSALLLLPIQATGEGEYVYQAEEAAYTGALRVIQDPLAAGGQALGQFEGQNDTVTFEVEIPGDGLYDLTFRSRGIGGEKVNIVLVDGQEAGQFHSLAAVYGEDTVRSVFLTAGAHRVTVTPSWGWIVLDTLEVTPAAGVPEETYGAKRALTDRNATEAARRLFEYLCDSYGHVTLSGQVCSGGRTGTEIQAIYALTGRYPAILGLDMMDYAPSRQALGARSDAVEQAISYHGEGGIVTFCWHWNAPTEYLVEAKSGNPTWWGGFYTENSTFDIDRVMRGEDEAGLALLERDIGAIASQLQRLQDAGVPVLWRPLHEASGGWFWWGAKGPEACKWLWRHLYEELTETYGLHNLIWVWNGQKGDWYPGDDVVDIIGEDIYASGHSYGPQTSKFLEALSYSGAGKMIALTENGVMPSPDEMEATGTHWAWFCTWSGEFVVKNGRYSEEYTDAEQLKRVYESPYVITRDELPDLR